MNKKKRKEYWDNRKRAKEEYEARKAEKRDEREALEKGDQTEEVKHEKRKT